MFFALKYERDRDLNLKWFPKKSYKIKKGNQFTITFTAHTHLLFRRGSFLCWWWESARVCKSNTSLYRLKNANSREPKWRRKKKKSIMQVFSQPERHHRRVIKGSAAPNCSPSDTPSDEISGKKVVFHEKVDKIFHSLFWAHLVFSSILALVIKAVED